jgi:phage gp29-like protein
MPQFWPKHETGRVLTFSRSAYGGLFSSGDAVRGQTVTSNAVGRFERDIASDAAVMGRRGRGWLLDEIPHTSPIVRYGSRIRPFDYVFGEMPEKDPDLYASKDRLETAVLALPRDVVRRDESTAPAAAAEAVALCKDQIGRLSKPLDPDGGGDQWTMMQQSLSEMWWQGTSFVEPNWSEDFFIDELVERPMRHFGFVETETGSAELRVRRMGTELEPIPTGKIIFGRNRTRGFPWGYGTANFLYWIWKAKLYNLMDWAFWLERWARPIPNIKWTAAPSTGDADRDAAENDAREATALNLARRIHGDGSAVYNDGIESVEFLTPQQSGAIQYGEFYAMCARSMARAMLLETTTSDLSPGPGSYNKAQISQEVGADRPRVFAPSIGSIIESTIFRWICGIHLPKLPESAIPRYVINTTSAVAFDRLYKGVTAALESGFGVPESHAQLVWSIPRANPGEAILHLATTTLPDGQLAGIGGNGSK